MTKILSATAENGKVSVVTGDVPNVQILSAGKAASKGFLILNEDDKYYVAIPMESITQIIDNLVSLADTLSKGQWTGSGTVAPSPALVAQLETLKTVTTLCFFPDNIQDRVHELGSFGVVALGPVVASTTLAKDKVVRSEKLTERPRSDRVHCAGFKVHQDGAGYVLSARCFIVVDIYSLQLKVGVTMIGARWVDTMFIGNDLPELQTKKQKMHQDANQSSQS
jgi:hypothetical protein